MKIILCALQCEAEALIDHYKLTEQEWNGFKHCYVSESSDIVLIIFGTRKTSAVNVIEKLANKGLLNKDTMLFNIGSCAGKNPGQIYIASKLKRMTDDSNFDIKNNTYYPALLNKNAKIIFNKDSKIKCCTILTSDEIVTQQQVKRIKQDKKEEIVFDMEAIHIALAASKYLGPHQQFYIKFTSDSGLEEPLNLDKLHIIMKKIARENIDKIAKIIDFVRMPKAQNKQLQKTENIISGLIKDLKCSETLKIYLKQLIHYCILENIDYNTFFEKLYKDKQIPVQHKSQGVKIIESFKEFIVNS